MISEVDVRDWNKVDITKAKRALGNSWVGEPGIGELLTLESFIQEVEDIREKQLKHIPRLERKKT